MCLGYHEYLVSTWCFPPFPPQFTKTRSTYLPMSNMSHRLLIYLSMRDASYESIQPICAPVLYLFPNCQQVWLTWVLMLHATSLSTFQCPALNQVLPIFYFQCLQSGHSSLPSPNQPIVCPAWITARVFPTGLSSSGLHH